MTPPGAVSLPSAFRIRRPAHVTRPNPKDPRLIRISALPLPRLRRYVQRAQSFIVPNNLMTPELLHPVYDGYFADPAIFRDPTGVYYVYGTGHGPESDGRQFPILRSGDLKTWEYLGGALTPLPLQDGHPVTAYWAPECVLHHGKYYLYYSAGIDNRDETHRLRVAVSDHPAGPFTDAGRIGLTGDFADAFCIDASPFRDPTTGRWYLFFATDFFTDRVGTGTAVVPLGDDMVTPIGVPKTVLRATADWQIYQRNRPLYGKTWPAWHTLEGPFTWHHQGYYYCFYSGGNWQTESYGVSYGVARDPLGPYVDDWSAGGPSVLRAVAGNILGPGHNTLCTGPDGRDYIVYHAWDPDQTARRMFINAINWEPSATAPPRPVLALS